MNHDRQRQSRLPRLNAVSAPQASRPLIERVIANNGFLPHLVATLANAPVALEAYLTVSEINSRASLSLVEREVVQITAARLHGCEFCVSGHSAIAIKKAGLPAAQVAALQTGGSLGDARLDALLAFTSAVVTSRGGVSDPELQAFYAQGFGPQQALEVLLGVSLATLCNFANVLASNEINPELQAFRPGHLELPHVSN